MAVIELPIDRLSYPVLFLRARARAASTRSDMRRLAEEGYTLMCKDEGPIMSVDDVRQRIVWLVSSQGHLESSKGFGLPRNVATATTVSELLEILIDAGFIPRSA